MDNGAYTLILTALTTISTIILVITTIVYTRSTGRLVKSEFGPKLYVYIEQVAADAEWDNNIMIEFCDGAGEIADFGFVQSDKSFKWVLHIVNNGKAPATGITLDFSIKSYKNNLQEGANMYRDFDKFFRVLHHEVKRSINIDYLPPNNEKEHVVFYLATFPEADFIVHTLNCKEGTFLKKDTLIEHYVHPEFSFIESPEHLRRLYGVRWKSG